MADITPITREEFYLAKAGGQDVPVPSAVTREEYYLEKLSNDNVVVPTPVTRREKFLYFACGGEIDLPSEEKMTRLERLIAKAGGMDVSTPTAVTRLEKFWANVEGGGWKTITGTLPLTFRTSETALRSWTIYGNNTAHIATSTAVLPLTFTTTEDKLRDWVISGNDEPGTEQLFPFADIDFNYNYGQSVLHIWSDSGKLFMQGTVYEISTAAQSWKDNLSFTLPAGTYACNTISVAQYGFTIGRYIKKKSDNSNILGADSTSFTIAEETEVYLAFYIYNATISTATQITVTLIAGSTAPDHYIPYQQGVGEQRVDGYYVPLTISQRGQTDKTVDIYIGENPLTEGQQVSKTSTGVDIELFEGENTISTTLYNKPETAISYVDYLGVGEKSGNDWQIPLTISDGTNTTSVNVPIDAPLTEGQSVTDTQTINTFEGENTIDTMLTNKPQMTITYKGG